MPNNDLKSSHISSELMYEFANWHLSAKYGGGGSYSFSMMQSLSQNLLGGFEAMYHPQIRDFVFNYGFKYSHDNHTILGQYIPIAKKDSINFAYINRLSNKLNLFGEFRASPEGFSESTFGFKLRFSSGVVSGTINSNWRMTSSIQMMGDAMLMTTWNTIMDMSKPDKPVSFGIAVSFGGGM